MIKVLGFVAVLGVAASIGYAVYSMTSVEQPTGLGSKDWEVEQAYIRFVALHGREVGSRTDYTERLAAFAETYHFVKNYKGGVEVEINKFADWTAEEKKTLTGLRHTPSISFVEGVEEEYDSHHPRPLRDINWYKRGHVAEPKAQGKCGSCWAFSGTAAIESAYSI